MPYVGSFGREPLSTYAPGLAGLFYRRIHHSEIVALYRLHSVSSRVYSVDMTTSALMHTLTLSEPDGMFRADCSCGWRATSASEELRNWNTDGHVADVRDYDVRPK